MIPKILHFCWFGGNKKSPLIEKCIESWKKFCPDYEIVEWNEDNFDVHCCKYVEEAYEMKKWAFVSDYCRFYALEKMGGIYLDTDVELLKPLDPYLHTPLIAFEDGKRLAPGLVFGCEKGDGICKELLAEYDNDHFKEEDGSFNPRTVCVRATDLFLKHGLVADNTLQQVAGYTVYPTEYFNPYDMDSGRITIGENTVSVHHYAGSWVDKKSKFRGKVYNVLVRIFGKRFAEKIRKIVGRK